jgi:hypothetical protein
MSNAFTQAGNRLIFNPTSKVQNPGIGVLNILIHATLADGLILVPVTESRTYSIEVFCATAITMDPSTAYTAKKLEHENGPIEFELPSFLPEPADARLEMSYMLIDDQS